MIRFTDPLSKATAAKFPPLGPTDRAVKEALLLAVSKIKALYTAAAVTRALEANDIDRAIGLIRWDVGEEFLMSVLPTHLRSAYELAGHEGAKWLATDTGVTVTFNIITPQAVEWLRTHAAEFIRQWGDSSREAIRDMIVNAFENPDTTTIPRLARAIKADGIGLTKQQTQWVANMRARLLEDGRKPDQVDRMTERYAKRLLRMRTEMIARTELKRAQTEAQKEQWRQAIEAGLIDPKDSVMEWTTRIDPRTCEDCIELDGARAEVPGGEFRSDSGVTSSGPPEHPQCLPGDSLITTADGISAASKRWYDGELVVLDTAAGHKFSCTPNHPVLTRSGWVPAGSLHVGDDVVGGCVSKRRRTVDAYHQQMPARIEDIADAFGRSPHVTAVPMPSAAEDFHGDGVGSKVAVVWTDRPLRERLEATGTEGVSHGRLEVRDANAKALSGLSGLNLTLDAYGPATGSLVGRVNLSHPTFASHLRPLQSFSGAASANIDTRLSQPRNDGNATNAVSLSELQARFPGEIAPDQIVNVERKAFHGWVYNLETASGWYIADGIVAHNCRCMLIIVPRDSKHKPSRAKPNDETPGIRPISTLRG